MALSTATSGRPWSGGFPIAVALLGVVLSGCQGVRAVQPVPRDRLGFITLIRSQVRQCWDAPRASGSGRVLIALDLNVDGTLAGRPQVIQYPATPDGPMLAQAAIRAVERCINAENPLKLPPDLYASWKAIEIAFDTR